MWQQEFLWFFTIFHHEFRKNNAIAFEVLMVLAVAHLFGFYNPKQLADFLEVPHQQFYTELKDWSIYQVKKMLLRFMVKQAAEQLTPVMSKSAATRSRAGMTLSLDNSVMERCGKLLRCTWSWYSGRYHTTKADVLIFMLTQLKTAFLREGIDITQLPLTMDSAYVSQELRQRLHQLGFIDIIIAGKGNDVFTIDAQKWDASTWKKVLMLEEPKWGIDVPSCRTWGYSPTFGSLVLFFFRKSTTRSFYLMNFSQVSLRGVEIWHIWKQHHVVECFWKIMKSIFKIRSMQLQGDGLYTALLIKVLAYLLALRL